MGEGNEFVNISKELSMQIGDECKNKE